MEQDGKRLRKGGAVTVAVPGDAADYVDGFRKRYDPHVTRIVPHITLAFAADLDVSDWMLARHQIKKSLVQLPPFTVHVAQPGMFMDDFVLWLQPTAPHGELLTLRQTILESFPDVAFDRAADYVPHISVGFFRNRAELLEAEGSVSRELVPFSFRVAYVSYLQADEGDIWQCVDTVELGGLNTGVTCPES
ncbi:MAG: 2'-5' RNA ligase family protein [Patescibacteria group bacterium]